MKSGLAFKQSCSTYVCQLQRGRSGEPELGRRAKNVRYMEEEKWASFSLVGKGKRRDDYAGKFYEFHSVKVAAK